MNWARRIFISLGIAFFIASFGIILLSNWSAFGWKALAIPTSSMRPTMPPGSLVLVHRVSVSSLKVGDVITYNNPSVLSARKTITHRIIKSYLIAGKIPAFVTKGDANPSPDTPIVGGLVLGKAVWHVPYIGYLLIWSKTWAGVAALIYLPSLLIMIDEVRRLSAYFKESQPYKLYRHTLEEKSGRLGQKVGLSFGMLTVLIFTVGALGPRVDALLGSNRVSLINNRLTVAKIARCTDTTTTNNNNITVNNSSSETASSGSSSNTNNTSGGSSTSGNAINNNSTTTTITVTSQC